MTKLLYLQDFDVTECDAKIASIQATDDGRETLILNQTCFYPRGGGQDWDIGKISTDELSFEVEEVRIDPEGNVHHIGKTTQGSFTEDASVNCQVDKDRRLINTRLHSAAHVIDMAVDKLELDWIAGKGQHS